MIFLMEKELCIIRMVKLNMMAIFIKVRWKDLENIFMKMVNIIKYEGDFVNDKKEGKGKYIEEDGNYYDGEWANDKKNGKGQYIIRMVIFCIVDIL